MTRMSQPVVNAMTIDVEDYFHVSAFDGLVPRDRWTTLESRVFQNTERLLALLDQHQVRATFFVLGWVAEHHPSLVARIATQHHEIASHGYAHRLIYDQAPASFREDIRRSKDLLESISGRDVHGYRAPSYSVTTQSMWALDALIEEGYRYDASIFPVRHDRYGIPSAPRHPFLIKRAGRTLMEAPPSTIRVGGLNLPIAGGGYFRLLPYEWTRWGISRLNQSEGMAAIFYIHPWEIDDGQPRLPLSRMSALRHYRNLEKTEAKLHRLFQDFRFAPLGDLLDELSPLPVPNEFHVTPLYDPRPAVAEAKARI